MSTLFRTRPLIHTPLAFKRRPVPARSLATPARLPVDVPAPNVPRSKLDDLIQSRLIAHFTHASSSKSAPICSHVQYRQNAHTVLDAVLPSEPYPPQSRRADHFDPLAAQDGGDGLVLVIHATEADSGVEYTLCSGFIIQAEGAGGGAERYIISCAHTLEEIEHRHPSTPKRTFILLPHLSPTSPTPTLIPISSIPTSLPRSDILIARLPSSAPPLRSLPISPYPIYRSQEVLVHFFGAPDPPIPRTSGIVRDRAKIADEAEPLQAIAWPDGLGWRRWVRGRILGYRSYGWREVEPGNVDPLPYILTSPLPTPGSSGGPILDATSGAVVGIISGTRMDNRVEGERGWGASAENVYELFSLAGFTPASKRKAS